MWAEERKGDSSLDIQIFYIVSGVKRGSGKMEGNDRSLWQNVEYG